MTSENKQNIDDIINHFMNISNDKINDTVISQLIEIKKLTLEEQKNSREYELKLQEIDFTKEEKKRKDRQSKFPNSILSNPSTTAVIAALAGFVTSSLVAFIQGSSNLQLEKLKFQSNLIAKATESNDKAKRLELLQFNIDAGLIEDPRIISKLNSLISKGKIPQSATKLIPDPNRVILPLDSYVPTVNDFTGFPGCYIAAYSHEKQNSVYSVGNDIYVLGRVRVSGTYQRGICQPKGYEGKDISGLDYFKELFDKKLPKVCRNKSCWAGGDTGVFVGIR